MMNQEERLEKLRKMIYELARGNFAFRIELSDKQDDIEAFSLMLNLLAEELSDFFVHPGSFGEKDLAEPYAFLLDSDFNIYATNSLFNKLLEYPHEKIINQPIHKFTDSFSFENLRKQIKNAQKNINPGFVVKLLLTFLPLDSYPIDCWGYCHILTSSDKTYYFIRGLKIIKQISIQEELSGSNKLPSYRTDTILQFQADIQKIRAVHQFILEHLHEPLPSISSLSRLFHLNEYKLKKGFKELYQITIFKFHLEKRLGQAMVMIKNTPTSLKIIAYSLGFRSFPHFSKVFKNKYGYPPSYYRKKKI